MKEDIYTEHSRKYSSSFVLDFLYKFSKFSIALIVTLLLLVISLILSTFLRLFIALAKPESHSHHQALAMKILWKVKFFPYKF